jgi:hypothetical protein
VTAHLQTAAAPGGILASERTTAAAQAAMLFGRTGLIEVEGKRQSLRVFPPIGRKHEPPVLEVLLSSARIAAEERQRHGPLSCYALSSQGERRAFSGTSGEPPSSVRRISGSTTWYEIGRGS